MQSTLRILAPCECDEDSACGLGVPQQLGSRDDEYLQDSHLSLHRDFGNVLARLYEQPGATAHLGYVEAQLAVETAASAHRSVPTDASVSYCDGVERPVGVALSPRGTEMAEEPLRAGLSDLCTWEEAGKTADAALWASAHCDDEHADQTE